MLRISNSSWEKNILFKMIIARGAEAVLIKKGSLLLKRRIKKGYRHPQLDLMLRVTRTRREARLLVKAAQAIPVPTVKAIDSKVKAPFEPETELELEFIQGRLLSDWLDQLPIAKALEICRQIGLNIAKLHELGIIHGDLTTSNMILKGKKVYFIDFGLGFHSLRIEDRAVDLHLLKEALKAKHFERWQSYFEHVLEGYSTFSQAAKVIERLKKIELRGRYKQKQKLIP